MTDRPSHQPTPDEFRPGRRQALRTFAALSAWPLVGGGCGSPSKDRAAATVVVYTALDREFSEPILEAYAKSRGVRVPPKYDVESTKTVGLTQLLIAEADRPRCDLFWNNEILNTLRLHRQGLLQPSRPAHAAAYPDAFKARDGTWYGFAARARILLVNTK